MKSQRVARSRDNSPLESLTRRVVRLMIAKAPRYLLSAEVADFLQLHTTRRVYDVFECLYALGCLAKRKGGHYYKWIGAPTLHSLPDIGRPFRDSSITVAQTAQYIVRYFTTHDAARTMVWKGTQLRQALHWSARPRVVYDAVAVFRGLGLFSPRPKYGAYAFAWTPECMLPLVEQQQQQQQPQLPPPLPLLYKHEEEEEEEDTNPWASSVFIDVPVELEPYYINPLLPYFLSRSSTHSRNSSACSCCACD